MGTHADLKHDIEERGRKSGWVAEWVFKDLDRWLEGPRMEGEGWVRLLLHLCCITSQEVWARVFPFGDLPSLHLKEGEEGILISDIQDTRH